MEKKRKACKVLVGNPERKGPQEGPRCRWEGDIKVDFREEDGMICIGLTWLRTGTSGGLS
jgi:hypothetical protein